MKISKNKKLIKDLLSSKTWFSVFIDYTYNTLDIYYKESGLINSEYMKLSEENNDLYNYMEMDEDEIIDILKSNKMNISIIY